MPPIFPKPPHEIRWPRRIVTAQEAVRYINATGYCMLFPVANVPLSSVYFAVTRRNPQEKMVWDKYSRMVWSWKDELPRRGRALYAKYFRGRGTLISLARLPDFLALSEFAGGGIGRERAHAQGRIGGDARVIWEALENLGPLATLELRHACKMETKAGSIRFRRAMVELQRALVAVHSGTEQETTAWPSARYDLTFRAFPREWEAAREISPEKARAGLAAKFVQWHASEPPEKLARLFGWSRGETAAAISATKE